MVDGETGEMKKKIIIIGGGAAGMMAAISASGKNTEVHIYEKNEKLGKKLYITGKGRCNVTNACQDTQTLLDNVNSNRRFLYSAFYSFGNHDMMRLLEENGLQLKTERGQRVFPASDKSSDVIKALTGMLRARNVHVHLDSPVSRILSDGERVSAVELSDKAQVQADAVIIACGGISYPSTGSTGDGYRMAQETGHSIVPTFPSLVPLVISEPWCRRLQGLSLKNVGFTMSSGGKKRFEDRGEMMFTHFGITGPLVLSASAVYAGLKSREKTVIHVDLKPALSEKQLDERVLRDFSENLNRQLVNSLKRLMPSSMIPVIIELAGLSGHEVVRDIKKEERQRLVRTMKDLVLHVQGTRGYNEAVVTRGGVNVRQVFPETMESRKLPGLYFAGEVLDLDAMTGGYNLQIAWSTGHMAGTAAREALTDEEPEREGEERL